jgi:hypothetical protein
LFRYIRSSSSSLVLILQRPFNSLVGPKIVLNILLSNIMSFCILFSLITRRASLSSGQSFWLLVMRSRVRFPILPWGFFLEGEDSHGDHGLGSLVELRLKARPGNSYSYITIHLIGTT